MLNKNSMMFPVNSQTLTILVCMLIVSPVISDGVSINFQKNFDMVNQEGNPIEYMPSDGGGGDKKDGLYFMNGKWFDQFNTTGSSDGRIAEFHSYVPGFVSVPGIEIEGVPQNHVLYLNAPSKVLIFYPNQLPQLGRSEAYYLKMEQTKLNENKISVDFESLVGEYPEIYAINNNLPFIQVPKPIEKYSARSLFIYEKLKMGFDGKTPEETLAKSTPNYDADPGSFATDSYQKEVTKAMADFYVLKNENDFRVRNLRESNTDKIEERDKIFDILLSKLNPSDQVYINFYNLLNYLCQKTLRNFFFGPNSDFLRILFKDLLPDELNLDKQFEINIAPLGADILFDFEKAPFFVRDREFEDPLFTIDVKEKTPLENSQDFYWRKRIKIVKAFEELISEYTKYLPDGASQITFNSAMVIKDNYDSMNFFFGIIERSLLPKLFQQYMDNAKKILTSKSLFKTFKMESLSTESGILNIRSFFLLYGYIDPDVEKFPTDAIIYYPANIFETSRRMILI